MSNVMILYFAYDGIGFKLYQTPINLNNGDYKSQQLKEKVKKENEKIGLKISRIQLLTAYRI